MEDKAKRFWEEKLSGASLIEVRRFRLLVVHALDNHLFRVNLKKDYSEQFGEVSDDKFIEALRELRTYIDARLAPENKENRNGEHLH